MKTRSVEVIDYIPLTGIRFNELFPLCYWFVEARELHVELGNLKAKGQAHKRRNGKWYPGEQPSDVDELVSDILDRAQTGPAEPVLEPTGK